MNHLHCSTTLSATSFGANCWSVKSPLPSFSFEKGAIVVFGLHQTSFGGCITCFLLVVCVKKILPQIESIGGLCFNRNKTTDAFLGGWCSLYEIVVICILAIRSSLLICVILRIVCTMNDFVGIPGILNSIPKFWRFRTQSKVCVFKNKRDSLTEHTWTLNFSDCTKKTITSCFSHVRSVWNSSSAKLFRNTIDLWYAVWQTSTYYVGTRTSYCQ